MKISFLVNYKIELFFVALIMQLLYPFLALLLVIPESTVRVFSFSILVFASFTLAVQRVPRLLISILGGLSLLSMWCNFMDQSVELIEYFRIYSTSFFYFTLIYILTRNFLIADTIDLKVVIGAMCGYLLIGYLGSSIIEMMDFHHPGSFKISDVDSFNYYYFSFISMLTVGFGDILPVTSSAKSLTIFISLFGQFYMAIGIASFVAKFITKA